MRIAFYAPLKSPNHPVVSGDREMARLLVRALQLAGHTVEIASELRAYLREPDRDGWDALRAAAAAEVERIGRQWSDESPPDLCFTYHPYYKSPDLIAAPLATRFALPYVTAEASLSARRNIGAWSDSQQAVADAVLRAAVNFCLTRRDRDGLSRLAPAAGLTMLPPFIDTAPFMATAPQPASARLATVAMMRPGDKLASYRMLADALAGINDHAWTLDIAGDGPARGEVEALFARFGPERIAFHGLLDRTGIARLLSGCAVYVWPGCGEAFGLAYLEAQASGLPVVAQATAGVPEVVRHGETGLLTPDGDIAAFTEAIRRLLIGVDERSRLGRNGRRHVQDVHSLDAAGRRLASLLPGAA